MAIIDTLRYIRRVESPMTRIIFVNVILFIVFTVWMLVAVLFNSDSALIFVSALQLPPTLSQLIVRPWSLLTYIFVQTDFFHLAFNMVWVYLFGTLMQSYGLQRHFIRVFFAGALSGAFCFIIASYFTDNKLLLTGASAGVMAIVAFTTLSLPSIRINLVFLGSVKLLWIGLVATICCLMQGSMPVFFAHFGGVCAGVVFWLIGRKINIRKNSTSIDVVIKKLKKSGYASLTDEEKRLLFRREI